MLVRDVILDYPALDEIKPGTLEKACIDRGLEAYAEYSAGLKRLTDLVIADLLVSLVNSPDWKDGDSSQTYPREALLKTAGKIYTENGVTDKTNPTITDRTNIW